MDFIVLAVLVLVLFLDMDDIFIFSLPDVIFDFNLVVTAFFVPCFPFGVLAAFLGLLRFAVDFLLLLDSKGGVVWLVGVHSDDDKDSLDRKLTVLELDRGDLEKREAILS